MAQKPSIPKGMRDFSPEEMAKRNYIFNTIHIRNQIITLKNNAYMISTILFISYLFDI